MSLLVVPYNASMKLGSGYNSYTQQLCVDHAVVYDESVPRAPDTLPAGTVQDVAQSVTFRTEVIDKISDLTDVLNINGNLTVKAAGIANATGTGSFINSNKIKESDLNFLITCKVVNQTIIHEGLNKFMPLSGLRPESFTDVYGDCFISGFQIGGEFNALISIKVRDKSQLEEISAKATLAFTTPGFTDKATTDSSAGSGTSGGGSGLSIDADAQISKTRNDVMSENETTISVSWTGGGQRLKSPTSDWNYETLREAAIKFPELVAMTPVRTNAILTKYTALKSFYAASTHPNAYEPLSYENAGMYTTTLQDAYLDYKNLYKELHLLGMDVDGGKKKLRLAPTPQIPASTQTEASSTSGTSAVKDSAQTTKPTPSETPITPADGGSRKVSGDDHDDNADTKPATDSGDASHALVPAAKPQPLPVPAVKPLIITKCYDPTIYGLEQAKTHVRFMMGRIVNEVDAVTKNPDIAMMEERAPPYMAPLLFKLYLPLVDIVVQ